MTPMLAEALRYARDFGMHVFPIDPQTKRPTFRHKLWDGEPADCPDGRCVEGECGHKHGTTDPDLLRAYWAEFPDAWLGVWLAASGLCVVDVDPRNGGTLPLGLPGTWTARTPGRGLHLYYRVPAGVTLPTSLGEGVDLKHNGYVLLSPSPGYRWLHPSAPLVDWKGRTRKAEPTYEGPTFEYSGPGAATEAALRFLRPYGQRLTAAAELGSDRNNSLFLLARRTAQLVNGGEVRKDGTLEWLIRVGSEAGVPKARQTAKNGWNRGLKDAPVQLTYTNDRGVTRVLVTAGRSEAA